MTLLNVTIASNYPDFMVNGTPDCATTDPDIFFPERGSGGQGEYATITAKRICRSCSYKTECLEWAIENGETGIWGGTTEKDRRYLKRQFKNNAKIV